MEIESESDILNFVRNSENLEDKKVVEVLRMALKRTFIKIPSNRELLAERLELFFEEFPEEKPIFCDFNKHSQKGDLKTGNT